MNLKGLSYKTEWVDFPDIEAHCKRLGISSTGKSLWDGSDLYTLPAIHDLSTGVVLADSIAIAKYLDATYADTPQLFPDGTLGLQEAFTDAFQSSIQPIYPIIGIITLPQLYSPGAAYIRKTREQLFGMTFEELTPKGDKAVEEWGKFKNGFDKVDGWFAKTDNIGPYILGDVISWGDIVVASIAIWLKLVFGEESQQWKEIALWHGGRWSSLLKDLDKYTARH